MTDTRSLSMRLADEYGCSACGDEFTLGHALKRAPGGELEMACPSCDSPAIALRARICEECDYPVDSKPHLEHCPEAIRG